MEGEGIYKFKSGNKYIGTFLKGKKHGKGIFNYKNGDSYEGDFRSMETWRDKEFIDLLTGIYIMVNGKMIKAMGKGNIFLKMATHT